MCADVLVHPNSLCSNHVLDKYVCDFYMLMYAWVYTHECIRKYVTVCASVWIEYIWVQWVYMNMYWVGEYIQLSVWIYVTIFERVNVCVWDCVCWGDGTRANWKAEPGNCRAGDPGSCESKPFSGCYRDVAPHQKAEMLAAMASILHPKGGPQVHHSNTCIFYTTTSQNGGTGIFHPWLESMPC